MRTLSKQRRQCVSAILVLSSIASTAHAAAAVRSTPVPAGAGAYACKLLGYEVGTVYPVSPTTRGSSFAAMHMELVADNPVLPNGFTSATIITSVKSYTIGNIEANAKFATKEEASSFADRYVQVLKLLYPSAPPVPNVYQLDQRLGIRTGACSLTVLVTPASDIEPKWTVTVGLTSDKESPLGKAIEARFQHEMDDALLNYHAEHGSTKGLQ